MKYQDKIYGEVEITESVILDLINSPELQRLKDIDQAGYYEPYHPDSKHTRYEHSIGVFLLLKKYQASLEEQIAGLIHDISHSAFSHAIDYALSEGSEKDQSHQDNYFEEYMLGSGIPKILEKYGYNASDIIDEKSFPLLETQLPDLCADRIDYSLRGLMAYKVASDEKARSILEKLKVENKKWVFTDFDSAYEYAKLFKTLNSEYYAAITTAVMFRRVGDYLKYALGKKYIIKQDLYSTDRKVMEKINKNLANDGTLDSLWKNMNNGGGYKNDPNDYDAEVYCKSRIVDPICWHQGVMKKVSQVKPSWAKVVQRELKPKGYFVKYVN